MREVPATEFTRNFGQYREIAQREPVAVTSHGRATGYFISVVEYEELVRLKASARRTRAGGDLAKEEIDQMASSRMAPEHDYHQQDDDAEALIALAEDVFADAARAAIIENDRLDVPSYGGLKGRVVIRPPGRSNARKNKIG